MTPATESAAVTRGATDEQDNQKDDTGFSTTEQPARLSDRGAIYRAKTERLGLRRLADIITAPGALDSPRAVLPGLAYAGRLTLLPGPEKIGKSTLLGHGVAAVTTGGDFLGASVSQGPVLYVSLEEHQGDLARRLVHFGADDQEVEVLEDLGDKPFERLARAAELVQPTVVVIDSLSRLAERYISDASSAAQWNPVMGALVRLARYGAGVVLVHHATKGTGRYRDSTAIGAAVDLILTMARDEKDGSVRQLSVEGRFPVPPLRYRQTADGLLRPVNVEEDREQRLLAIVTADPGCSKNEAVEKLKPMRKGEALALIDRLLTEERIHDDGTPQRSRLYVDCPT